MATKPKSHLSSTLTLLLLLPLLSTHPVLAFASPPPSHPSTTPSTTALHSTPSTPKRHTVLVTGGAGYIGSHTCLELLSTNRYDIIVIDTLDNSSSESLERVRSLAASLRTASPPPSSSTPPNLTFRNIDVRDETSLNSLLTEFPSISSCIHFAGLKAVGESVSSPLSYYDVNVAGTTTLLRSLRKHHVPNFVFSSSATVYGDPSRLPITEDAPLSATNPYGRTKLFIEEILRDCAVAEPDEWNVLILRYFNPIGAHGSGEIGEDPQGVPNNLMPFVAQVCVGRRERLSVFGDDYDTVDGTGVRDYIHVVDLAKGHVAALDRLLLPPSPTSPPIGCQSINLGTGTGISVLELVEGMSRATGKPVPYEIVDRRPGDVAAVYADAGRARDVLGWKAELGLTEMCEDTWRWQRLNPFGYREEVGTVN